MINQTLGNSYMKELNEMQSQNHLLEEKIIILEKNLQEMLEKENKKKEEEQELKAQLKSFEEEHKISFERLKLNQKEIKNLQIELTDALESQISLKKIVNETQNLLEKSLIKLKTLKTEHLKLKAFSEKLVSERQSMAVRAAVGFGELTPRPKFEDIISKCGFEEDKYADIIKEINNKHSTEEKFLVILEKIEGKSMKLARSGGLGRKKTLDYQKITAKKAKYRPSERFTSEIEKI